VQIDNDPSWDDLSTCPCSWGACKHAVGVVLAAAKQVQAKRAIPCVEEGNDLGQTLFSDEEEDECEDDKD
jgi:uncharacterized Zn finger protein